MLSNKSTFVLSCLIFLFSTQCLAAEPAKKSRYHTATDKITNVFGEALYPVKKVWEKIIDTLSPHHPIIRDFKAAINHVIKQLPDLTEKVTDKIHESVIKINDEATDVFLNKADIAAQNLEKKIENGITNGMRNGCDPLQEMANQIMRDAQSTAIIICDELEKKSEQAISRTLKKGAYVGLLSTSGVAGISVAAAAANRYAQSGNVRDIYCICLALLWSGASLYAVNAATHETR